MPVKFPDSVEKIVKTYFSAITKVPFTYNGEQFEPKLLMVKQSIAKSHECPPGCGACCERLSLDYIESEEKPNRVTPRLVNFNGQPIKACWDKWCFSQ